MAMGWGRIAVRMSEAEDVDQHCRIKRYTVVKDEYTLVARGTGLQRHAEARSSGAGC